ncbi:hypothetical protein DIE14_14565 [Burkholderia sp. Bp9017]|nr:hypothetical protein DIE14_14565 [Burkholderia sp. Bp9017]RQZ34255.1 hypothetical protein DIE13_14475 [Burkholderia sp. Bp9016]
MTYAQFHESDPGSIRAGTLSSRNFHLVVFIDFSQTAHELSNVPKGRPTWLCGWFDKLFNKVIHMHCG